MNFTLISTSLMHFALCVAILTVFLVTSECTATDADAQPVVTAPTAASVPDAVPHRAAGENLGSNDDRGEDEDEDDDDDDDQDTDKDKKTGAGSTDPGGAGVGLGGHAAPSQAGVVAARIPDPGTDHRPNGSGVSPGDGRTGDPLSSPLSPDHSNGSGGSGSGSTSTATAPLPPPPPPPPGGGSGSGGEKTGGLPSGATVTGSSTGGGIGITSTGSKINSTTTTKMVDDDKPKQDAIDTSTAPITPLINPTKTVQQQLVENKNDGSNRKALLSAFPTLLTLTLMAVVSMY